MVVAKGHMATLVDKLTSVLGRFSRTTSDGTTVISEDGLIETCFMFGIGKHNSFNKALRAIVKTEEVRQGEWNILAIQKMFACMGIELDSEERSVLEAYRPEHANQLRRKTRRNDAEAPAAKRRSKQPNAADVADAPRAEPASTGKSIKRKRRARQQLSRSPALGAPLREMNLRRKLVLKDEIINSLRTKLKQAQQKIRRQVGQIDRLSKKLEEAATSKHHKTDTAESLQITFCKGGK